MPHKLRPAAAAGSDYMYRGYSIKAVFYESDIYKTRSAIGWRAEGLRGEQVRARTLKALRREIDAVIDGRERAKEAERLVDYYEAVEERRTGWGVQ